MDFHVSADISRPPRAVFATLRDLHVPQRDPKSLVPVLELTTPGPVGVGSRFHEEVRVLPFARAFVDSEVTRFDPPAALDYRFTWRLLGLHMRGTLRYRLGPLPDGGTHLAQEQSLEPEGVLRPFGGAIARAFQARLETRIADLKALAERS